ncbi:MAG: hypothetical protein NPIRA05_17120 [Nitrospirales bacterium]|nr:MAG: hypothetical protein NPIRA05_17120 [Nitrospirales bacterium]
MNTLVQCQSRYSLETRTRWPWPSLIVEQIAGWMNELPGDVWLDAACGTGQLGRVVQGRKQVIGLDRDEWPLQKAQAHPFYSLIQGSLTTLPLSGSSVDGIVSIETLEHIPNIETALSECARCLKHHGYLLLTVPSVTLRSLWDMSRKKHPVYCCDEEHVREFSSVDLKGFSHKFEHWKTLEGRFRDQGFRVHRRSGAGFLLPMWQGRLEWLEHGMNVLYRESVNAWLGKLPVFRKFPYYLMYVLQFEGRGRNG